MTKVTQSNQTPTDAKRILKSVFRVIGSSDVSCSIKDWSCPYHDCMSDRCAHQHVTEVNKCDFGVRFCSLK